MSRLWFIFPLVLSSCTNGIDLDTVDYTTLFTDSNSKVWLVNKVIVDNANIAPVDMIDKDIFVFHHNGHCDYIPMRDLTRKPVRKGYFDLSSKTSSMTIDFKQGEIWSVEFPYITEDSVLLQAKPDSDIQISIQLIPFPEL